LLWGYQMLCQTWSAKEADQMNMDHGTQLPDKLASTCWLIWILSVMNYFWLFMFFDIFIYPQENLNIVNSWMPKRPLINTTKYSKHLQSYEYYPSTFWKFDVKRFLSFDL
jgi:hypothetical protein